MHSNKNTKQEMGRFVQHYIYTKKEAIFEYFSPVSKQFISTNLDKNKVDNLCQNITLYLVSFHQNLPLAAMFFIDLLLLIITRK